MSPAELTFNKMNEIVGNPTNDRDLIDFFVTVGDNLYPVVDTNPSDDEFATMMSLF